tara:strand:- start:23707 stop:23958 length:252 start_codon:yes stop_codon:yes gene_type:complete
LPKSVAPGLSAGNSSAFRPAAAKRPPKETAESTAFLETAEQRPGEQPVRTFTGWMFASSPALNALEHPVYDVWVLDYKNKTSG